jgi:hypothetical protein
MASVTVAWINSGRLGKAIPTTLLALNSRILSLYSLNSSTVKAIPTTLLALNSRILSSYSLNSSTVTVPPSAFIAASCFKCSRQIFSNSGEDLSVMLGANR